MGLKGDFEEIQRTWKGSSLPMKLWLILSGALATTSIATLSDTVFRWKGFIKDGIIFYQEHISETILIKLKLLWSFTTIPPGVPDLIILSSIYIGANIKIMQTNFDSENATKIAIHSSTSYIGSGIGALVGMHIYERTLDSSAALGLFLGSMLCASISYIRSKSAAKTLWFIYSLTPFAIILILGAISSGLARTE